MRNKDDDDQYANLQRLNSAVLARFQWTSSLIGMQKSGEEIHQRRNRNHRKVNEFIQELIGQRSDANAFDDQGALERYRQFKLRHQYDNDDLLDEFNRRLRSLNRPLRTFRSNRHSSLQTSNSTSTIDIQTDDFDTTNITDRSTSPIAFPIDQLTFEQSLNENETKSFSPLETLSTRHSFQSLHRPRAQRIEGSEIILHSPSSTPPIQAASNVLLFNNCFFPRSLTMNRHSIVRKDWPTTTSNKCEEQFDRDEVFHMLDQLNGTCSKDQFTDMLSNLKMSSVQRIDSPTIDEDENEENETTMTIQSNLFDQTIASDKYFQTFTLTIENPQLISVYAMTIGIMQLTMNHCVPYSILDGHRPVLQISKETNFKRIRSKKMIHSCRVTAIDSLTKSMKNLKKNDIILKINDESVWQWDIELIRQVFIDLSKKTTNRCSLTIIRLNQPFNAQKAS